MNKTNLERLILLSRIDSHPILGELDINKEVTLMIDGEVCKAYEGDMIASAMYANGKRVFRYTKKFHKPRGLFCAIGKCTDCIMTVNGVPNIRTCITPVEDGMIIETQEGLGQWERSEGL
ncbi:2Fe-2S iron-sulfur cluster protein [Natranaerovirga pectinivora]|uniref:2Fe-2S iron-sulfur cluster protein n=1 Tax=Natranaerovirga pectinivora TaxID=682400 RepID=A0A4R3MPA8_9FIRM|nr:(2Fe-2S)-binding protein [Natranaerovirga pectinivora]TCT16101.1 2Fe-2S iron-sulfur cluster protein [Natranaerovirga pectinivora]